MINYALHSSQTQLVSLRESASAVREALARLPAIGSMHCPSSKWTHLTLRPSTCLFVISSQCTASPDLQVSLAGRDPTHISIILQFTRIKEKVIAN